MKGRKPIPTHLKKLRGNPGKRALNRNEPLPEGDLEDPPDWMSESQKDGWAYAIQHAPRGLLKRLDQSVLVAWVVAEDLHRTAAMMVAKYGVLTKTPHTGAPAQSPYLPVLNRQAVVMLRAVEQLGFSPSSRSRVQIVEDRPADEYNPWDDL